MNTVTLLSHNATAIYCTILLAVTVLPAVLSNR